MDIHTQNKILLERNSLLRDMQFIQHYLDSYMSSKSDEDLYRAHMTARACLAAMDQIPLHQYIARRQE